MSAPASHEAPDLYGILGVPRDADNDAIRLAYREKAKIYHPDVEETGDKGKFNQLRLARDILLNAKWRGNYDSVGVIEEDQADNAQAELITVLTGMFGQTMHAVLQAGNAPAKGDFLGALHSAIKNGFQSTNAMITQLQSSREQLVTLQGRFKVISLEQPNHLETIVAGQLQMLDKQIDGHKGTLRQLERGRMYLNDVTFLQAPG